MGKKRDLDEILKAKAKDSQFGIRCSTCASEDVKAFTKELVRRKQALGLSMPMKSLWEITKLEFPGYLTSAHSFRRHLKECLGYRG